MARGFWDLFGSSFDEFGSKFSMYAKSFGVFYLIPFALCGILILLYMLASFSSLSSAPLADFAEGSYEAAFTELFSSGALVGGIIVLLAVIVITVWGTIFLYISYYKISLEDKELSVQDMFVYGKEYFWKFLGLYVVFFLAMAGLFIALIIPAIIFGVFWLFSVFYLIHEKTGVFESFSRSFNLVRGRWWRTFGFTLWFGVLAVVASIVISLIPLVGGIISSLVVMPFSVLFFKNFYLDMKAEKGTVVPASTPSAKKALPKKRTSRAKKK